MKSWVVEIAAQGLTDAELAYQLRTGTPAVLGRLRDGKLVLDVRTILPHQEVELVNAVQVVVATPRRAPV
jgi:L-seryl-tRNA(Ser) seleniumtransferase